MDGRSSVATPLPQLGARKFRKQHHPGCLANAASCQEFEARCLR